ncbi:perilipin-2-like isoform X2 [Melanotaenia boesemani]|uniref:perilipin-2-like isoform X2 n=1 Tax=Melanotaenia boesemani TaxID=1250792 RepID=UPI001C058454|nr:perilipin-2-like isoform X2 [Melanotaenia boesemani]
MNNNLKVPSAASRLAQLPVVRSVCATLSVLYTDTKCYNPNLKSVCEALESRVSSLSTVAYTTVSPVFIKFEPQISIANDVACKTLDWLETSFPVLLSPTDEVAAAAKNKMHEIQDVVSIVAKGTVDCVQHTITWVTSRMLKVDGGENQPVVDRTVNVAIVGLDFALSLLEGLMDQVLPPSEEDKGARLEGFEAANHRGRYPGRIISLGTKLCRRTCYLVGSKIQTVEVKKSSSRSSTLVQDLQTTCLSLVCSIRGLPHYVQHRAVAMFFFINQMYALSCPSSQQKPTRRISRLSSAAESSSSYKEPVYPQTTPAFRMRPTRTFAFDTGFNGKGYVRR